MMTGQSLFFDMLVIDLKFSQKNFPPLPDNKLNQVTKESFWFALSTDATLQWNPLLVVSPTELKLIIPMAMLL